MELNEDKLKNLLREVKTIKAYSIRVEGMLEEVLGGVGTAQKSRKIKFEKEMELRDKFRARLFK